MPSKTEPPPVLDLLKLDQSQWAYYLDLIESRQKVVGAASERRRHQRHAYLEFTQLGLVVDNGPRDRKMFLVRTFDLSASGVGLLHGRFIQAGQRVHVMMLHRHDGRVLVSGTTRRCELLEGHVHAVGVEFDEPIDPADFILMGFA